MDNVKANKRSLILAAAIVGILIVLGSFRTVVTFITDYQWFSKNGFVQTFLVELLTKLKIFIPVWIIFFVGLGIYLLRLKKKYSRHGHISLTKAEDVLFKRGIWLFSALSSLYFAAMISGSLWLKGLMYFNNTAFGSTDPIFKQDLGFYFFKLPMFKSVLSLSIVVTMWIVLITIGFYFIAFNIKKPADGSLFDMNEISGRPNFSSIFRKDLVVTAIRKIAVLGALILLLISASYWIGGFNLVYSSRGAAYGASFTDINVTLIGYRVSAVVAALSAVTFAYGLLSGKRRLTVLGPIVLVLIAIIAGIFGGVVQQLVVEPDEISKEKEYLEYTIAFTQAAFGLEDVEIRDFPSEQKLTQADLIKNEETISNIRVNDARPLKQTFNQIQGIRLYYQFNDIDVDRYTIDGQYRQVFIAPRELNFEKLNDDAKTWLNRHIRYTHGYGVVMSPVNAVTAEGQPELMFRNIPPVTETDLVIDRPEIYFGELSNDYIIIGTDEDEFDYPSGSDNVNTRYEGKAGVPITGINKLLYAYRMRSMKMLFSSAIGDESRIVFYRNIHERVRRIAPFLTYDKNPYLVLNEEDGKLYWIIDAYTSSIYNPYSQPFMFNERPVNYLRNSVKVVVDAYEGDISFYAFDDNDPVLKTYQGIFKDLFTPGSEMPQSLLNHIRYPQDYFNLQSEVYSEYHVENPVVFYNGEDIWDIANEKYMGGQQQIESNYVMFKLPDGREAEFALILPYTPKEKPNMTSLFVARNDGEHYGKLFLYKFSKNKTVQGPMMIESRIDQNSDISPQFTLWGQEGSQVLRGNVIVVPVEDALLYVEPVYLQADNTNSLPEMKRVIVSYEDKIVMEETLEEALSKIFGIAQSPSEGDSGGSVGADQQPEVQELLNQINDLFEDSEENMDDLRMLIQQLNETLEESETEPVVDEDESTDE